jgi:3-hydroxy-9,10-secoandrosta-1,3,5(10)-triene-9,17-dione monooxygenase reductase component
MSVVDSADVVAPGELVAPEDLRRTCAAWPTGIAVVTSVNAGGGPVGLAVNSFTSLSLAPPLVLFCAALSSTTWPHIRGTGRFAVNVLAADQKAVAEAFARSGGDKFASLSWRHRDGLPELDGIAAVLRCSLAAVHPGGDHEIAVGRVEAVDVRGRGPLVFHEGAMLPLVPLAGSPGPFHGS